MELTNEAKVLVQLSIQQDGEEYTVGDPILGMFIRVPYEAVLIIELLDGTNSIKEIKNIMSEKNIDVDVFDFVNSLYELELVHSIDDHVCFENRNEEQQTQSHKFFTNLGLLLFHPFMNILYAALFLCCLIIFIVRPDLFPTYEDMFVVQTTGVSLLLLFVTSWILLIIHEFGHYLATIKHGIPVKFRLSLRFYWLVVEADMTGIWSVTKRQRFIPYLGGMFFDTILLFIVLSVQILNPTFMPEYLQLVTLILVFRFGWQCLVFLRTDIYYIIMNLINIPSLHDYSKVYLKGIFKNNSFKSDEFGQLNTIEQRSVKTFTSLYILGGIMASLLFLFYSAPGVYVIITNTFKQLINNNVNTFHFWDGILILIVLLFNLLLWIIGALGKYNTLKST
ncbi:hypothetical protein ACSVDA_10335 [Cytobacillus sp. Hm23]